MIQKNKKKVPEMVLRKVSNSSIGKQKLSFKSPEQQKIDDF